MACRLPFSDDKRHPEPDGWPHVDAVVDGGSGQPLRAWWVPGDDLVAQRPGAQ